MKKLLLALTIFLGLASAAAAQCNGVFPANTLCGNLSGVPAPPKAFTSSGTVVGPGTTVVGHFATWANTLGTQLADFDLFGSNNTFTGNNTFLGTNTYSGTSNFTGPFKINGNLITWPAGPITVGVGNVSSVGSGAGLLGGPITTTGSLSLAFDPGSITNCTLAASVSGGGLIVAIKTQSGVDPTSTVPCTVSFRNATQATGDYTAVLVTAATSITTGATGSTFGSTNTVPFRLWATVWNNAGTVALGLSKQSTINQIFPLNEGIPTSTTACNACTNATSAGVFYTTAALSTKAFRIFGYLDWGLGLTTAGTYASGPTAIQMFGPGIKKPGEEVQRAQNTTGIVATGSTAFPAGNVIPVITAGDQYMTQAITPQETPNLLRIEHKGTYASTTGVQCGAALFQDAVTNALAVAPLLSPGNSPQPLLLTYTMQVNLIVSTTFRIREGCTGGTNTFNGSSSTQLYGGVIDSRLSVIEIKG